MKITAQEFFQKFKELFDRTYEKSRDEVLEKYKDRKAWTKFMLEGDEAFIPKVIDQLGYIRHIELECRREFFSFDLCVWDKGNFEDNKPRYRQPLYLHTTIEHEEGPNPEEEFWKLLHWYSPLKILISYPSNVQKMIKYFNRIRKKVCSFHARSPEEQYLLIFGTPPDKLYDNNIRWRGWFCEPNDDGFREIT